ncbi:HD domain-containing protein, partial [Bacteroides caccae]|uniref:HD domain-containing protein n=3 Tax=Pseudomonadati TaxID=3379134 RepID=UPI001230D937
RNSGLLARIAPERIREELDRILLAPRRRAGVEMLVETGLMKHIIPEVYGMVGCGQPPQWHPEGDVYTHTLMMLEALGTGGGPVSLELALAVLLHDIGKPACREVDETGRIRFSGHDKEGAVLARVILRRLKYSNAVVDAVADMVERHMRFMHVRQMKKSTLRMFMNSPFFQDELELHRLDCLSSNGLMDNWQFIRDARESYQQEPLVPPPLVTGRDLKALGFSPGPDFKKWLSHIQELQLEGALLDRREALLRLGQIAPVDQNTLAEYLEKLAL